MKWAVLSNSCNFFRLERIFGCAVVHKIKTVCKGQLCYLKKAYLFFRPVGLFFYTQTAVLWKVKASMASSLMQKKLSFCLLAFALASFAAESFHSIKKGKWWSATALNPFWTDGSLFVQLMHSILRRKLQIMSCIFTQQIISICYLS